MTSKVQPAEDYCKDDVKMMSKVQPATDYWTIDQKPWGQYCAAVLLVSRKTKSEMAKLLYEQGDILNE